MAYKKQLPKRAHIIARDRGWAIKKEGSTRASSLHQDKNDAISSAKRLKRQGHDIVVHKKDGSIQKWEKAKKHR
ncbi:MAG: DUF2188 domain-containing protein [Dehalococcoidia bacterium]|nr:DUF2188 domain-containing protein [Dehalococcoidia bacterium]MDD5493705.1 DUF2188 domain-containing protein [Dehalococcoidia bacterium]